MQRLIYFIQRYRFFLFFLFLEFFALYLILNNRSFHRSKFVNSTNSITGGFYNKATSINDYFYLKKENTKLIHENLVLKNKNTRIEQILDSINLSKTIDSSLIKQRYSYISGTIEKNQFSNYYNFLLIDLGKKDSIQSEMAVVNHKGIIGVTEIISANYSRVQSILNKNSKINAKLKNSNHFGSLEWNGMDYNTVQLLDIPRQANVSKGDTIITGGRSSIFPEGILIGKVVDIEQKSSIKRVIDIELFNDMSNLKNIYVIKDFDREEIKKLENKGDE